VGRVYLHVVVDTYGGYAFGLVHTSKQPEAAVAVLHNDALPFYQERQIDVTTILTDNPQGAFGSGREYCGTERHPYELYLQLNAIEHRTTRVRRPQTNGFVERFNRTVLDEFFGVAFRMTFYEAVEQLQTDLDTWLVYYNTERPHYGYSNMGKRPIDTIEQYLQDRCAESAAPALGDLPRRAGTHARRNTDPSAVATEAAAHLPSVA
jgi:hypothetical protein